MFTAKTQPLGLGSLPAGFQFEGLILLIEHKHPAPTEVRTPQAPSGSPPSPKPVNCISLQSQGLKSLFLQDVQFFMCLHHPLKHLMYHGAPFSLSEKPTKNILK